MTNLLLELVLRVFFISFTEQLVITLISARLLKSYNILRNKSELIFASLTPAMLSYIPIALQINKGLKLMIGILVTTCFISLIAKVSRVKFSKVLATTLVAFVVFLSTEFLCVVILIYSTGLTTDIIASSLFYSTIVCCFERIVQTTIIYLLYVKDKSIYKKVNININVFEIIIRSKKKRTLAVIVLTAIVGFLALTGKAFMFDKILQDLNPIHSISICILSVLLPAVSVYSFLENVYNDYVNNEMYFECISVNIKNKCIYAIECAKQTGDIQTIEAIMKIYQPLE